MNPVVLKTLIISGGTLGVGIPGVYYSYPYISNLINPISEEGQKPSEGQPQNQSENSHSITLAQESQTSSDQATLSGERAEEKNDANQAPSENSDGTVTNNKVTKPENKDLNTRGDAEETVTERSSVNDGSQGSPTKTETEQGKNTQENNN